MAVFPMPGPMSGLSRFLAEMQDGTDPEACAGGCLAGVADSCFRSMHAAADRERPEDPLPLVVGHASEDRLETLGWILQAFEVMQFSDGLVFETATLLDRFYMKRQREETSDGGSQRKLLAAICISLKLSSAEEMKYPLKQVVSHLSRDQVPLEDVLQAETAILSALRYVVGTPTPRDFLHSMSLRIQGWNSSCTNLAEFLMYISLADPEFLYRFPHCVLAAAALVLALSVHRAGPHMFDVLLEDLRLHCPEQGDELARQVLPCCRELHALWCRSVDVSSTWDIHVYTAHVIAKFATKERDCVAATRPPLVAPVSVPPRMDVEVASRPVARPRQKTGSPVSTVTAGSTRASPASVCSSQGPRVVCRAAPPPTVRFEATGLAKDALRCGQPAAQHILGREFQRPGHAALPVLATDASGSAKVVRIVTARAQGGNQRTFREQDV